MRYLSQRYAMPYKEGKAVLTDVGSEAPEMFQNETSTDKPMNIYVLELNNDIKGILQRKQYIEALIAKTSKPDLIVLPELALCSSMGNSEVW